MELLNIFQDVFGQFSEWATGGAVVVVAGIIAKIFWKRKLPLKMWAKKGAIITKEIGEAFLATSDAFGAMDSCLKEDGRLIENNVKDLVKAGKEAKIEWHDVIIHIRPKK